MGIVFRFDLLAISQLRTEFAPVTEPGVGLHGQATLLTVVARG